MQIYKKFLNLVIVLSGVFLVVGVVRDYRSEKTPSQIPANVVLSPTLTPNICPLQSLEVKSLKYSLEVQTANKKDKLTIPVDFKLENNSIYFSYLYANQKLQDVITCQSTGLYGQPFFNLIAILVKDKTKDSFLSIFSQNFFIDKVLYLPFVLEQGQISKYPLTFKKNYLELIDQDLRLDKGKIISNFYLKSKNFPSLNIEENPQKQDNLLLTQEISNEYYPLSMKINDPISKNLSLEFSLLDSDP